MAKMELDFPDDFMEEFLGTSAEEICIEALNEAAPILAEEMKKSARASILHEGESEMVDSIAASKAKRTKDGSAYIVNVNPKGESKKHYYSHGKRIYKYRVSNALKAIWKEYGVAGRQAPRPFIANATNNAKSKVMQRLQEVYNRRTGSGS